ncbi:MAG: SusC/RagA family TonB-linked outer membrane protein [Paludibacter sp.]|nr:SusC/RagA family TonB-linked outer membrane protein [Paludibacter sp.]
MKKNNSLLKRVLFVVLALAFYAVPWAQTKTITGVVKDATGESIIGASVVVKGTTLGTITNINGSYSLGVPTSAKTLVVSYIGMETQELTITGSVINVALKDATTDLDELVVVGYGVVKKRDLTGSVSSVKSSEIMKTSSSNAMQAMQGKVPGLDIQQSSGQAGAGLNITLRGNRSITASNNPLILVDGVEYGSTLDISPSDIESMEVLKDASSTAIYGTRGANGVIIITTKRGKSGATKVSFNSYISSNQPTSIPQIMFGTTEVTRRIQAERYKRDKLLVTNGTGTWGDSQIEVTDVLSSSAANGLPYSEMDIYNNGSYTNWADLILQNGLTQNYEMAVSGGSEKTNFNISLGTMLEEGLLKNDALDRYNAKINIDHKANKFLKIGTSLLYTYKNHDKRANVFGQALKMTSIANPYDADGQIILKPSPTYEAHANPLLDEIEGNYQNNIESTRFFGNGYIEITPIRNVFFKSMFALVLL